LDATKPEILTEGANAGKPSKKNFTIDTPIQKKQKARVLELLQKFPLYPNIELELIKKYFLLTPSE
ncbi:MAG TPA: glycine hydroxymethyltransferase, partial [Candidatus Hydrogenedens sp.]|nr:glycine hydroxymethyltransferase [Candidatus Hydrogenedens sp.]